MKVAIAGGSGFLGKSLVQQLQTMGYTCVVIGRKDFSLGVEHLAQMMTGVNIVVNLSGAPIIKRWSDSYKKELYESRILTTRELIQAYALTRQQGGVFVCANAVGRYSSSGCHDETSTHYGDDFLAHLCREWEEEAFKAGDKGMRSVVIRFGVILGRQGGALSSMLPLFKWGLGGVIGDGKQHFSWIHQDDLVGMIVKSIDDKSMQGAYNGVACEQHTNETFSRALAKSVGKRLFLPVPAVILRLLYGEGSVVLTSGQCALPQRMIDAGYRFKYPTLEGAIQASL